MTYYKKSYVKFNDVSYRYENSVADIFEHVSLHINKGWTGLVGANGSGKTTFLRLVSGELSCDSGSIETAGLTVYCPQRTDFPPLQLVDLIDARDSASWKIKERFGIESDWFQRWDTLSDGEKKRAQLGVSFWLKPDILAVDEPCNHLDRHAREMIESLLSEFKGSGLIVSHDRKLLDKICDNCLFFTSPGLALRPGGYSEGSAQESREGKRLEKMHKSAHAEYKKLKREADRRRDKAARADSLRSKRHLARGDNDGRSKINLARLTGKDAVAGSILRQIETRVEKVREKKEAYRTKKKYDHSIAIKTTISKRNILFHLPAGHISLGEGRELVFDDILMKPDDRIAVTGPNGSGKSSLIKRIVAILSGEDCATMYIPQEISIDLSRQLRLKMKELNCTELGEMMTVIRRLGSDPGRVLDTMEPSPGEVRKMLIAFGLTQTPNIIIMDEPTNHLDIVSTACLESALMDCGCGLLLVSHDRTFLTQLTSKTWEIDTKSGMLMMSETA